MDAGKGQPVATPAPTARGADDPVEARHRSDEPRRRRGEHVPHRAGLGDPAVLDDDEAVCERYGVDGVVGRDHRRRMRRRQLVPQHGPDVARRLEIEERERLIEEHSGRPRREGARDRDALLLPSRELRRTTAAQALEADARHPLIRLRVRRGASRTPREQAEGDVPVCASGAGRASAPAPAARRRAGTG